MPFNWIGPAATVGGAVLGNLLGGDDRKAQQKANAANEARYGQALGYGQAGMGILDNAIRASRATRTAALGKAEAGVKYGRDQIESVGGAERNRIAENFQKEKAANTAGSMQRGLFNTSTLDAANRGASIDMNRANLELTDRLAELRSGYALNEAAFLLNAYRDDASAGVSDAMKQNSLIDRQIGIITGRTDVAAQNGGAALGGQLAGQFGDLLSSILKDDVVLS
jgi:hypothetical protein